MARDVSFFQYLRAHGNTAGPTQRPLLTGAISAVLAFVPYETVLRLSGARGAIAKGFEIDTWFSSLINLMIMLFGGVIYAAIFKRAANDCRGGWIFGASYGFLLWLIAPITLWQLISSLRIVVGGAAMGLFGAHIIYGLVLGIVFPWTHFLIQSRLDKSNDRRAAMSAQVHKGG